MGYLAYYLVLAGIICLIMKAEWMIPLRKYLMTAFLTAGLFFASAAMWEPDAPALSIFLGLFATFFLCLFIRVICTRNRQREEILHIPAGSYELMAADRANAPTVQVNHLLLYQGIVYLLSTFPPEGKPALILHAHHRQNTDVITADIAIDNGNGPVSAKQALYTLHSLSALLIALLFPISYTLCRNGYAPANLFGAFLSILFGYFCSAALRNGGTLLIRLLHWFCIFIEVAGWIAIPVMFFL
ncbi:MAG: hypothetical protein UFG06_02485 [Lachnospiraceae bacterium]|nr:hypothetical protein [Lachnospiraceae bacterium]